MNDKPIMLTDPKKLDFEEKVKESVVEIHNQIAKKKWEVVRGRLKERKMLHLLRDIKKKRFKPIIVETLADREEVYVNDGSYKGLLLVTFLKATKAEMEDREFKGKLLYF